MFVKWNLGQQSPLWIFVMPIHVLYFDVGSLFPALPVYVLVYIDDEASAEMIVWILQVWSKSNHILHTDWKLES